MRILNIPWKWNIPNALSLVRILLVPVFVVLYVSDWASDRWAFGVLLASGVTDVLDGFIARHFNQITECGKLLDPLSDKLTQIAVVVALTTRYAELLPLAILCFIKELSQGIGGVILLKKGAAVRGSKWFGKVSTVVFYGSMLILVLWHDSLPMQVDVGLVILAGVCMLFAFVGYLREFIRLCGAQTAVDRPEKG